MVIVSNVYVALYEILLLAKRNESKSEMHSFFWSIEVKMDLRVERFEDC